MAAINITTAIYIVINIVLIFIESTFLLFTINNHYKTILTEKTVLTINKNF